MNKINLAVLAIILSAISLAGCDRGPKLYKVSGKVLIDGQPLERGFVEVIPTDFRAATGEIGPGGVFTLTTFVDKDGVVAGTHTVTVLANESKGPSALHWYAPKKYSDPVSSGLTLDIQSDTDSADIILSWEGGKPFTEKFEDEGDQFGAAGEGTE